MSNLSGKTILVYRAEDPLADGICRSLAEAGARLFLACSVPNLPPPAWAEDLRRAGQAVDWACPPGCEPGDAVRDALQAFPALDGLLVLPVRTPLKAFLEQTEADWEFEIEHSILTPFFLTQAAARHWTEAGLPGRVVFVSSVAGQITFQETALSGAAHAALDWLARVAAIELGGAGITVNAVAAGWTDAGPPGEELCFTAPFRASPADQAAILTGIPMRRFARPEEIGRACAFLLSEDAGCITGTTLPVDGGFGLTKVPGNQPYPGRKTWVSYQPENSARRKGPAG